MTTNGGQHGTCTYVTEIDRNVSICKFVFVSKLCVHACALFWLILKRILKTCYMDEGYFLLFFFLQHIMAKLFRYHAVTHCKALCNVPLLLSKSCRWPAICIHGDKAQSEREWVMGGESDVCQQLVL